ncbi:ATP-binding protein [Bifidobacterium aquikefiricola]|uniref:ATP-binding protein n=1 Tax=Bifidobacterium aquikefiricola TaxID=3059038 RepID=A0AB39U4K7_9BIFI
MFERPRYIEQLNRLRGKHIIKVLTGVRRCGKSTLFKLFQRRLRAEGVEDRQIHSMNFEDLDLQSQHYSEIYKKLNAALLPESTNYIFLDEVQQIPHFEKIIDSLFIKDNVDVYVTGSNAFLLSGELATLLSGRYIEIHVYPLSFAEMCSTIASSSKNPLNPEVTKLFSTYLTHGGFPFTASIDDELTYRDYMNGIVDSVLIKDVLNRRHRSDTNLVQGLARYLIDVSGNLVNPRNIANALTSAGLKTSAETVNDYLTDLESAYLFYRCDRYDIAGKKYLSINSKIYPVDSGLRRALLGLKRPNRGSQLESLVFLELRRRGYDVYVGTIANGEVDFVATKQGVTEYYQVSETVQNPDTYQREVSSLKRIRNSYPKFLLTQDAEEYNDEGIQQLNIITWLLNA